MNGWSQIILPILTLLVAIIVSFILPRLGSRSQAAIEKRISKVENDCWTRDERMKLESRLTALETRLEGLVNLVASRTLHSPHELELDSLLEKNLAPDRDLSEDEVEAFIFKLSDIEQYDPNIERKMAARLLRIQLLPKATS